MMLAYDLMVMASYGGKEITLRGSGEKRRRKRGSGGREGLG